MLKTRHLFIIMILIVALAATLSGCGNIAESVEESKLAGIEVESGWTTDETGRYKNANFTYAFVIKNTTEDKTIKNILYKVIAYDKDDNVLEYVNDFDNDYSRLGVLKPGMAYAVVSTLGDPLIKWKGDPVRFELEISRLNWVDSVDSDIEIASIEGTVYYDDVYSSGSIDIVDANYSITYKNNTDKDYYWANDGSTGESMQTAVVFRDEEGNITGGSNVLDSGASSYTIPADGELTMDMYVLLPQIGEPEYYVMWY